MANATTISDPSKELDLDFSKIFDMGSLRSHLPQKKRGLSVYFSGKSQSFTCLADAKTVDDLKKAEIPDAKRRKLSSKEKLAAAAAAAFHPSVSCRIGTNNSSCCRTCG